MIPTRNRRVIGKSKYGSKKVEYNGILFDSKAECQYYQALLKLKEQGIVTDIELQPVFVLQEAFVNVAGEKIRPITYKADFKVTRLGEVQVIDVKGFETTDFKLKKKMFEYKYPYKLHLLKYTKKYGWETFEESEARIKAQKKLKKELENEKTMGTRKG